MRQSQRGLSVVGLLVALCLLAGGAYAYNNHKKKIKLAEEAAAATAIEAQKKAAIDAQIAAAKAAIEKRLTDPLSAQYRKVVAYSEGVVCGEVNAKNKLGGYVGFEAFAYPTPTGGVYLDQETWWGISDMLCNDGMGKLDKLQQSFQAAAEWASRMR